MLDSSYSPMTIRFFILQAHYRSTLDFSNKALQGAEKGLTRLQKAMDQLETLPAGDSSSLHVQELAEKCDKAMKDDLNTPVLMAHLFDGVKWINGLAEGRHSLTAADLEQLKSLYQDYLYTVLGLMKPVAPETGKEITGELVEMILRVRREAKQNRDFEKADQIREELSRLGITVKDTKDGADWEIH
jgi:cysteinyl-tRNA synthetase